MRVDEDNGRYVGMVKGRAWEVWRFSSNEVLKNIGCLTLTPTFGIGGQGYGRRRRQKR